MANDIRKILGENVKKYRKIKGFSQEKFAEMIEIGVTSLSLIERGKGFATATTLEKMSSILNIPIAELMSSYETDDEKALYNEILKRLSNIKTQKNKLKLLNEYLKILV